MTGIKSYSTTAANNVAANTGINWDEGMSPAAVNNSARAVLADVRAQFNDLAWFAYGNGDLYVAPVYVSSTSFKIAGTDVTAAYEVGRRVKAVGTFTGTIYGTISSSAFSTDTTVGVTWDSGSLSNETLTIYLSQIPVTGQPVSTKGGTWTPADASGSNLSLTINAAKYTKIGDIVFAYMDITYPTVTGDANNAVISGLPYAAPEANAFVVPNLNAGGNFVEFFISAGFSQGFFANAQNGTPFTNTNMSAVRLRLTFHYRAAT